MIELALLTLMAGTVIAVVALSLVFVKALLWIVLLPVRFVFGVFFGLLMLPFLLLKTVIGGILMVVLGPLMLIALLAGLAALAAALIVPLLPLLFVAFVVWFVVRASQRPAVIPR